MDLSIIETEDIQSPRDASKTWLHFKLQLINYNKEVIINSFSLCILLWHKISILLMLAENVVPLKM